MLPWLLAVFAAGALSSSVDLGVRFRKRQAADGNAGVQPQEVAAWQRQRPSLAAVAIAAGLVLEEVHFEGHVQRGEPPLHESLEPLIALLVPVFFIRMGMLVDLRSFASGEVLGFAALLTLAAILGKLACGMAAPKGVSGLTLGLGMMPRGEVGLIFAGIGAQLVLGGRPVVDAGTYAAAVFMVVATTVLTPPLLLWSVKRE